ncbi:MAG: M20/M25/M40 family metallo-hydrolase [Candidatus Bathyarchaeia archaeon]
MRWSERCSIDLLRRMLEIYSPSGRESAISSFLADVMVELGFSRVWKDKANNVYGEIGIGKPTILLCGHMDTVPGEIDVKLEGDRLYGRGAVDAKSSLAAMVLAAASFKSEDLRGRVIVAGVVDEEGRGKGIRHLIREGLNVDYAIFGEPSGIRNITFAYKGHIKLKITCETSTGHIGAQHVMPNAIEKCFDFWGKLRDLCDSKYRSPYGIFYSLTPTVTRISGGGATRSIPDKCVLEIDLRLPPTISCGKAMKIIEDLIAGFRDENYGLNLSFKAINMVEPYVADKGSIVVKALREAIFEETGGEARLIRKTGTGDMNIFGTYFKVPAATYGPGEAALSHTFNESIDVKEYLTSIKIYKKAVEKILGYYYLEGGVGAKDDAYR